MRDATRLGEYATRGDYHRQLDSDWAFAPTFRAKLTFVRGYLDQLPLSTRVIDVGCGEGVLVEEYARRLDIHGVDANYSSQYVRNGSALDLPYPDSSFDRALCLDVLEHLSYVEQPKALGELHRVLRASGEALISIPNLAHLQSRVHFLLLGRLIRTASEQKHPGDRPLGEFLRLFRHSGFDVIARHGIFPTVPLLTGWIRRHPAKLEPLHNALTSLMPFPGLCFLNIVRLRKRDLTKPAEKEEFTAESAENAEKFPTNPRRPRRTLR